MTTRREFLAAGVTAVAVAQSHRAVADDNGLDRQIGITMSSAGRLGAGDGGGKIPILEWPRVLRNELDMTVLDLNSGVIESHEPAYLERVRKAADDAGCFLTNMKINRPDVDIGNSNPAVRASAIAECKRWIDTSSRLGLRWARPLPLKSLPDMAGFIAAYQELADYGADRGVQMIIENYGWMDSDPDSVPRLLDAIGKNVAAAPDTGNWSSQPVRYAGLEKLFPRAVTCDFKAGKLGPDGEHPGYDLKKCFSIGWNAGFRGPWCLEHAHTDRQELFRELGLLRDMLRRWMKEMG